MTTIRDMVKRLQQLAATTDLPPHKLADILVDMTALYSTVVEEVRESEFAYNAVEMTFLDSEEAANRSKIRARNTDAYRRHRIAKDTEKTLLESIRSLKVALRSKQEELRLG